MYFIHSHSSFAIKKEARLLPVFFFKRINGRKVKKLKKRNNEETLKKEIADRGDWIEWKQKKKKKKKKIHTRREKAESCSSLFVIFSLFYVSFCCYRWSTQTRYRPKNNNEERQLCRVSLTPLPLWPWSPPRSTRSNPTIL